MPDTPAYQMQRLSHITEITKSLPAEVQGFIADLIIKATDLPERFEIAERIQKRMGVEPNLEEMTPQERAEYQAQKEAEAEVQRLDIDKQRAEIQKTLANAQKLVADVEQIAARTAKTYVEIDGIQHRNAMDEDELGMEMDSHEIEVAERIHQLRNPEPNQAEAKAKGPKKSGNKV